MNKNTKYAGYFLALLFGGGFVLSASALPTDDQVAQACVQPLQKYLHQQPLTPQDEAALNACYKRDSCTNVNLSGIKDPSGNDVCARALNNWQNQFAAKPAPSSPTPNAATTTTTTTSQQPAQKTAAPAVTAPAKPAESEFHSTNDAAPPPSSTTPTTTNTPAQPAAAPEKTTTPEAAPSAPKKEEINWM